MLPKNTNGKARDHGAIIHTRNKTPKAKGLSDGKRKAEKADLKRAVINIYRLLQTRTLQKTFNGYAPAPSYRRNMKKK